MGVVCEQEMVKTFFLDVSIRPSLVMTIIASAPSMFAFGMQETLDAPALLSQRNRYGSLPSSALLGDRAISLQPAARAQTEPSSFEHFVKAENPRTPPATKEATISIVKLMRQWLQLGASKKRLHTSHDCT